MFSEVVKSALEAEIVGQTAAVNAVVRGVTRLRSGLTPRERQLCAYLLMGPTGTGKTHLVRCVAQVIHGHEQRLLTIDSGSCAGPDPHTALAARLMPLFQHGRMGNAPAAGMTVDAPPMSIIVVESLERWPRPVIETLAGIIERGELMLPDGRIGHLRCSMWFMTSGLCANEILDESPGIGFSGRIEEEDEEEQDRLHSFCQDQATEKLGLEMLGQLDGLLIFHRIRTEDLPRLLDRRLTRVNRWLAARGAACELDDDARAFLLERGQRDLRAGARDLLRAHRRFVEFPLSDLIVSGRIGAGDLVEITLHHGREHLHFTVLARASTNGMRHHEVIEVPVA